MAKQYGIDPRLVIWIQRNTGRDLQTFSDLAKIKCLDSRRRNFSAVKKIEDVRLPSYFLFTEGEESEPQETNMQETDMRGKCRRDHLEMIRQLYGVEELQGYTEDEIAIVKKYFDPLPGALEEFWQEAARTEALHHVQDRWIRPEDFDKWDWLKDSDYLVILMENQGCCRAGIRRKDLGKQIRRSMWLQIR